MSEVRWTFDYDRFATALASVRSLKVETRSTEEDE